MGALVWLPPASRRQTWLGASVSAWGDFDRALAEDPAGVEAVLLAADAADLSRRELAWVIQRESGWDPAARNPSTNASGLIQFIPSTLSSLGYGGSPEQFRALSRAEQAPWIEKLYRGRKVPRGDLFLANYWPAAAGKDDSYVIAEAHDAGWCVDHPSANWCVNKGLRDGPDGPITAGSVRTKGTPPSAGGPSDVPAPAQPVAAASIKKSGSVVPWLLGAGVVALVTYPLWKGHAGALAAATVIPFVPPF